jgi:hypothetical protein
MRMAKYGKTAHKKVEKAMHERKKGTLRSGSSGRKVKSRKQAIAIGLSEARRAGGKVPRKKSAGSRKKSSGAKKGSSSRKSSSRTSSSRKKSSRKTSSRKTSSRKSSRKQSGRSRG